MMPPTFDLPMEYQATGRWTLDEHERYLVGMLMFPNGPWKRVAAVVQTRTERQLRTHDQKYKAKLARRHQQRLRRSGGLMDDADFPHDLLSMAAKIEPIEFTNAAIQYDECIEFLVDALGDELLERV
ncbi:hypothetical protein LEN26_009089 [Aphanomyces euteiches]|nr:hypothetical protein LEN26_009089 [Aphanomyces euteiches]